MPRRYVPWSEKVFYLEQSKRKVQVEAKWHEGIFLGIKDESEIDVVGTPHIFSTSNRRVPKEISGDGMMFNSIRGAPWEPQPGAEGGVVNRVKLDVQVCNPRETSPTADSRGTVAKTSLRQAISGIGEVRVHRQMYRVAACETGIEGRRITTRNAVPGWSCTRASKKGQIRRAS